jgi:predicted nucleic acid-binding protein
MTLVLDSGAVTRLSERSPRALAYITELRASGSWPPVVPTMVLVESLRGDGTRDAAANRFLHTCLVETMVPEAVARRAAELRRRARKGSAVDALVVAMAEPNGTVVTGDVEDLIALAAHSHGVLIEPI